MKMAGLCWISVLLAVSLSIGDCEPLDIRYVARIAARIHNIYPYDKKEFSVAVNVPKVPQSKEELEKVILPVDWDELEEDLNNGKVYTDTNIVVAVPQKKTNNNQKEYKKHAEKQVLENLGDLDNIDKDTILVLYSWMSPCGDRCTNEKGDFNILRKIEELKNKGKSFAFVFYTVYTWFMDSNGIRKDISEADIKNTFHSLRKVIVDDNIFRCYDLNNNKLLQCFKCFKDAPPGGGPVDECVRK